MIFRYDVLVAVPVAVAVEEVVELRVGRAVPDVDAVGERVALVDTVAVGLCVDRGETEGGAVEVGVEVAALEDVAVAVALDEEVCEDVAVEVAVALDEEV